MNFAGKIRKVIFQTPPTAKDAGGELTGSWSNSITTFAKIVDVGATEGKSEGTEVHVRTRLYIIRYRNTITPNMRVSFENKYWEITGIKDIDNNQFTEITTVLKSNV